MWGLGRLFSLWRKEVISMDKQPDCVFCKKDFPCDYQLVSGAPGHWLFVLNVNPQTDLHGMIVLNAEKAGHCRDLAAEDLPQEAVSELGKLLSQACKSIKAVDPEVDTVLITSLNMGEDSRHLHFHLIPKRKNEKVRRVANPDEDGGGMFFMARKEIVVDTYSDFIRSTTNCEAEHLISEIREAQKKQITRNVEKLRQKFQW
jgi:diadenosine tetraphosphate (Ap4A) HIT family hydrolase